LGKGEVESSIPSGSLGQGLERWEHLMITLTAYISAALPDAKAWPFEEVRKLIKRLDRLPDGMEKTGPIALSLLVLYRPHPRT